MGVVGHEKVERQLLAVVSATSTPHCSLALAFIGLGRAYPQGDVRRCADRDQCAGQGVDKHAAHERSVLLYQSETRLSDIYIRSIC